MIIQVDTREQANTHIIKEFEKQGIDYFDEVLDFGDYFNGDTGITIERKKNLTEFANNCGKGHQRFKRELERLNANGGKMYILIEEDTTFEAMKSWINPKGKTKYRKLKNGTIKPIKAMSGEQMYKICCEWKKEYPIEFVFVDKKESANKIIELLKQN